ncbi:4-vinyl reductase [Natrinema salifodinae]|uniref:V4R domain-containing protein n=1 Tax=Natrinema salifodinae TaxID=1202768 RepID=A0A1I0Q9Y3_9EURY|nr:4-vinyl reductase [Natrinema salifodinae]SEW23839.1 V4R domain-containing protein [Natrinema salifodinae]
MAIVNTVFITTSWFKRFIGRSDGESHSVNELPSVDDRTGFEGSLEGSEVIGRSPLSYIAAGESVSSFVGKEITSKLAEYGLEDIEPEDWYPLAIPLAMLYDMRDEYGGVRMRNMGQNVPKNVEFPPELSEVDNALRAIDQAYHQNHRGGEIGSYEFKKEGPNEASMICENPYPCEFDKGLIRGVAKKFADNPVQVEEVGDQCRADGDHRCEYRIEWF